MIKFLDICIEGMKVKKIFIQVINYELFNIQQGTIGKSRIFIRKRDNKNQ